MYCRKTFLWDVWHKLVKLGFLVLMSSGTTTTDANSIIWSLWKLSLIVSKSYKNSSTSPSSKLLSEVSLSNEFGVYVCYIYCVFHQLCSCHFRQLSALCNVISKTHSLQSCDIVFLSFVAFMGSSLMWLLKGKYHNIELYF